MFHSIYLSYEKSIQYLGSEFKLYHISMLEIEFKCLIEMQKRYVLINPELFKHVLGYCYNPNSDEVIDSVIISKWVISFTAIHIWLKQKNDDVIELFMSELSLMLKNKNFSVSNIRGYQVKPTTDEVQLTKI